MKRIDAWQCSYCHKKYLEKIPANRHEARCSWNPDAKECKTCYFDAKDCPWDRYAPERPALGTCHQYRYSGRVMPVEPKVRKTRKKHGTQD